MARRKMTQEEKDFADMLKKMPVKIMNPDPETKPLSLADGPCASCGKPLTEEAFGGFVGKGKRLIWHAKCPVPSLDVLRGVIFCAICGEDIAVELDEKTINNLDGSKSHLDCYLREMGYPEELIDKAMNGEITIRQEGNGGVT